jgi:hypothetical protein
VISGQGFLGLPQKGISIHILKSEPSAIHHLSVVEEEGIAYRCLRCEDYYCSISLAHTRQFDNGRWLWDNIINSLLFTSTARRLKPVIPVIRFVIIMRRGRGGMRIAYHCEDECSRRTELSHGGSNAQMAEYVLFDVVRICQNEW